MHQKNLKPKGQFELKIGLFIFFGIFSITIMVILSMGEPYSNMIYRGNKYQKQKFWNPPGHDDYHQSVWKKRDFRNK